MSDAYDLLVVGRASVDVMFGGLSRWPALGLDVEAASLGVCAGTAFNTPAAAHRLGLRVAFVTTIGNDPWSRMIADEFGSENLPTEFLRVEDAPYPGLSVALNLDGDRGFVTFWGSAETYDDELTARGIDAIERVDARHLHAYVDESDGVLEAARARGMTVSLDAWGGHEWSSEKGLDELLAGVDVLFANAIEARTMTGAPDTQAALHVLAGHCPCVVIKCGAEGAMGSAGGVVAFVPSEPVTLVDTTGAGDCFNAGFLAGWLAGSPLEDALVLGVLCGGRAVTDFGGYRGCPRGPELERLAAARGVVFRSPGASPEVARA